MLDLDKDFSYQKKNITDDNINRQIKLYIPSSQNINLKIDNDLSDFLIEKINLTVLITFIKNVHIVRMFSWKNMKLVSFVDTQDIKEDNK